MWSGLNHLIDGASQAILRTSLIPVTVKKSIEDALIVATGVASSVLCITGYDMATSAGDGDSLNGVLLMFLGAALFCGVAYAFYARPRAQRIVISPLARRLEELKPVIHAPVAKESPGTQLPYTNPAERKAQATITATVTVPDEVAAARNLIRVYNQLLTELKDPSKQRTLKRWLVQQEDIIKAHELTAAEQTTAERPPAKRA
jgi:hypothetical protein